MSDAPSAVSAASLHQQRASRPASAATAGRGSHWRQRSPILVFVAVTLAGYVLLAALMIGLGFLLVDVVLPYHGIGSADESVNDWLAAHRDPGLSDGSYIASAIGDIPFIPALVILTALGAALLRQWRAFGLIVGAILVEVATYRVTSLVVHRQRPSVPRLDPDHLPVNQSYPSGHVAAAVVVYVGLALLLSRRVRSRWAAVAIWTLGIALPLVVALSRMYRGMHHPIDTAAGILMGAAAIAIALVATRAASEAARTRSSASAAEGS